MGVSKMRDERKKLSLTQIILEQTRLVQTTLHTLKKINILIKKKKEFLMIYLYVFPLRFT